MVADVIQIRDSRITEEFILDQVEYHVHGDRWTDIKRRTEDSDSLYAGHLKEMFPTETALPEFLVIENKFKNSLHDSTRLAKEGRGMPRNIPRGDKEDDLVEARVRDGIHHGYWTVGKGKKLERKLYMDLAGGAMSAIAAYYNDRSPYPQYTRLNPRYCYPTLRNNELYDLLHVETVSERVAASMYPNVEGLDRYGNGTVYLVCYYGQEETGEAITIPRRENQAARATVTKTWRHDLGQVPVAFRAVDTYDDSLRGIFDQLSGPMMVRNMTMRLIVDYLESIAHSPLESKNIMNADEMPGPLTHYKHDPDATDSHIGRVLPAAPAGTVWGLVQYMDQQESREAIEPSSRVGAVSQSIASGSFVYSTQGALTSFVGELQGYMADLREDLNILLNKIDEKYLDFTKPLVRSVGKKKTYTPSRDIAGWYYHTVEFGATAGLDRLNGDTRVLNHLSARLIDRGTARANIDYLDDDVSVQEKIDRENVADALLQRFATDPNTPLSVLAKVYEEMGKGGSLVEVMEQVVPELVAAEQAAQTQTGGPPTAAEPGTPGTEGAPAAAGPGALPGRVNLPSAPLQQVFVRSQ